ncbi:mitogen-activated protein kinase-binding protein 1-like [Lampris incognitus]|uniref:mitogen-activated protein kinase-binding protein 1-like n=1 Tax=Lampris incognitus TaxID=2546036 RepID=UPI0024B5995C|nr:mitogen-activated protein kinase-binding protein 1-like [Lampris incognitus]
MTGDGSSITSRIRKLLPSPSVKHRRDRKESLTSKASLEKVLGITASGNSGLACDPHSGLVAYPAGCVVVLLNPRKNRQHHIINSSRKTITALSFSPDGKYLVTGESGHLPAVRLWDVAERRQVAELQKHKYGISCVAFSPNSKYIVSVGNQHDMMVNVWAWKKDVVVAANKVSSKVTAVSFSKDSSYFVTAGNRHVKFWYLDHCKPVKASAPVPLLGRSGLLGELRNNFFCDVACGRGSKSDSTFCITSSGLLCEFNSKRMLDKWVDLQTGLAQSLSVSEDLIFCGCADGMVRVFSAVDLHFVCTLPRPHSLGTDISAVTQASHLFSNKLAVRYPDSIAVTYDCVGHRLSCVYSDHSVYVWDVRDVHRVGKVHSALFHAACVWDLQVKTQSGGKLKALIQEGPDATMTSGVFLSCSADDTIRLWCMEGQTQTHVHTHNILSNDLLNIIYVDGNASTLLDSENTTCVTAEKAGDGQTPENRTGIRTICVSPDGKHLASGDRHGILRVHDLSRMEEILKIEAHDAEILCLEYSKPETVCVLLATASRDRLIHILNAEDDYTLVQTLDEHSSSITAVRFAANDNKVRLISCGADKSIYFRTAHRTDRGTEFRRSHHVVRKTTLYDMGVDPTCKYAAVGCQDRCIRIFNISNGKQKKLYKGSLSEDGSLLRVQTDPSGQYVATSCSDKNISIFDFHTGECVATMFGHSEIVTGMKFTNDCKHLISVSGDSCIFVWRLAPELTINMRERLCQLRRNLITSHCKISTLRREMYSAPCLAGLSSDSDHEQEDRAEHNDSNDSEDILTNTSDSSNGEEDAGGSDESQEWKPTKVGGSNPITPDTTKRPRRRWSHRMGSLELMVKSMLDLRQLDTSHKKGLHNKDVGSTSSLQEPLLLEERAKKRWQWPQTDWLSSHISKGSKGADGAPLCTDRNEDNRSLYSSDYLAEGQPCEMSVRGSCDEASEDSQSPDSACSLGYDSWETTPNYIFDDSDDIESLNQDSSDEERGDREEEEERKMEVTSIDEALRTVTDAPDCCHEDFLKQNFETLADNSNMVSSPNQQSGVPRVSMSSRFLARGHNNRRVPLFAKSHEKDPESRSAKPPVSKVRPLMEGGQDRGPEDKTPRSPSGIEEPNRFDRGLPERESARFRFIKKRPATTHLWKLSNPTSALLVDTATDLHKSHSAQELASDPPRSPLPSSDRREAFQRPQQLFMDHDSARSSSHLSSPTSGSPQSPTASSLPWESPKLKGQRSYMNPTTSSKAKCSRSSSLGESLHTKSPPLSPSISKGRGSFEALVVEPSVLTSPSASTCLSSLSLSSSSLCPLSGRSSPSPASPHPTDTVSPSSSLTLPLNAPPSRIPLPKQPLSPRRSLCLEITLGVQARPSPAVGDPESGAESSQVNKPMQGKHLPQGVDPALASSQPVRQKRGSVCESTRGLVQVTEAKEHPLLSAPANTLTTNLDSDHSVTLETCRQAIAELHCSLKRTATLYTKVLNCGPDPSEEEWEMRRVLSEALGVVKADLDSLPCPTFHPTRTGGDVAVKGEGEKTLALLEQYSELLLKSVAKKLDSKT